MVAPGMALTVGGAFTGAFTVVTAVAELLEDTGSDSLALTVAVLLTPPGADGVTTIERAWSLVSEIPAAATDLTDRGIIAAKRRADLILVDATAGRPRVVATIVAGRVVYLTEAARIHRGH